MTKEYEWAIEYYVGNRIIYKYITAKDVHSALLKMTLIVPNQNDIHSVKIHKTHKFIEV